MQSKPSPEARLLNLIKAKRGKAVEQERSTGEIPSFSSIFIKLSSPLGRIKKTVRDNPFLLIVKSLRIGLICSILVFLAALGYSLKSDPFPKLPEGSEPPTLILGKSKIQPLNYYLSPIRKRNLFRPGGNYFVPKPRLKSKSKIAVPPKPKPPTLRELAQNLNLVGIIKTAERQAIIEDMGRRKTYYLKTGDHINKDIEILEIFENKVTLGYKDETMELIL